VTHEVKSSKERRENFIGFIISLIVICLAIFLLAADENTSSHVKFIKPGFSFFGSLAPGVAMERYTGRFFSTHQMFLWNMVSIKPSQVKRTIELRTYNSATEL